MPKGLIPQAFVQQSELFVWTEAVANQYKHDTCAICHEAFNPAVDICRVLDCGHVFHAKCVDLWFIKATFCPMCKSDLKMTFRTSSSSQRSLGQHSQTSSALSLGSRSQTSLRSGQILVGHSNSDPALLRSMVLEPWRTRLIEHGNGPLQRATPPPAASASSLGVPPALPVSSAAPSSSPSPSPTAHGTLQPASPDRQASAIMLAVSFLDRSLPVLGSSRSDRSIGLLSSNSSGTFLPAVQEASEELRPESQRSHSSAFSSPLSVGQAEEQLSASTTPAAAGTGTAVVSFTVSEDILVGEDAIDANTGGDARHDGGNHGSATASATASEAGCPEAEPAASLCDDAAAAAALPTAAAVGGVVAAGGQGSPAAPRVITVAAAAVAMPPAAAAPASAVQTMSAPGARSPPSSPPLLGSWRRVSIVENQGPQQHLSPFTSPMLGHRHVAADAQMVQFRQHHQQQQQQQQQQHYPVVALPASTSQVRLLRDAIAEETAAPGHVPALRQITVQGARGVPVRWPLSAAAPGQSGPAAAGGCAPSAAAARVVVPTARRVSIVAAVQQPSADVRPGLAGSSATAEAPTPGAGPVPCGAVQHGAVRRGAGLQPTFVSGGQVPVATASSQQRAAVPLALTPSHLSLRG